MTISSREFYKQNAERYSQVFHEFIQSDFSNMSHSKLADELNILRRMKGLIPLGARGLDAGCGAGARDVYLYWKDSYDMFGFDAGEENIAVAKSQHPEIADRVFVGNLNDSIPYEDSSFDFLTCNAVIQHIERDIVMGSVLPEFARVLRPGGILQLMFKVGTGDITIYDKDYGVDRFFRLYSADQILLRLEELGMEIIEEEENGLGGVMYFTDTKPVEHCLLFARLNSDDAK
tara:strand:- start:683 stop:1378 length:696 start_codon:yes stop_codon:yes gene_type:complete